MKKKIIEATTVVSLFCLSCAFLYWYAKAERKPVYPSWLDNTVIVEKADNNEFSDGLTSMIGASYDLSNQTILHYDRTDDRWWIFGYRQGRGSLIFPYFVTGNLETDFRELKPGDIIRIKKGKISFRGNIKTDFEELELGDILSIEGKFLRKK